MAEHGQTTFGLDMLPVLRSWERDCTIAFIDEFEDYKLRSQGRMLPGGVASDGTPLPPVQVPRVLLHRCIAANVLKMIERRLTTGHVLMGKTLLAMPDDEK